MECAKCGKDVNTAKVIAPGVYRGCLMTDKYNRVEMVNALRNDGLCSSCHFDLYHNPKTPEAKYD